MKVYIKAEESVCVNHAQVYLCDVLSLYCSDYETGEKLKKVRLYHFPSREKQRKIFSVLKVVEKIKEEDSQIEVVNMGPEDFVVSYEQKKEEKRDNNRTYNLLDIMEAVQIKPQDYSKSINTKEFQFVQKSRDGTQNYTSDNSTKQKKGKGLRSKYDLT